MYARGMVAANRPAVEPGGTHSWPFGSRCRPWRPKSGFLALRHDHGNDPWPVIGVAAALAARALLSVPVAQGLQHPRQTGWRSRAFAQSALRGLRGAGRRPRWVLVDQPPRGGRPSAWW